MKSIILGGGGDDKQALESHKYFYELLGNNKSVMYIPIALENISNWNQCLNWFNGAFQNIGKLKIELVSDLNNLTIEYLEQFGGIYIGGGNTFKLMYQIRESGFDNLLIQFLHSGIYYGGSAGAIIAGKYISTASSLDKNEIGLNDLSGLNILNGYSIWPHYVKNNFSQLDNWRKENSKLIGIGEDSAVVFKDKNFDTIGNNYIILD